MTTQNNTPKATHSKAKSSKPRTSSADRVSRPNPLLPILLVIGSILLSASCAPAIPNDVGDGGSGGGFTAPGAVAGIAIDEANIESAAFTVRWLAPTTTGTKADGTALTPEEIGYRIYYLADPAGTAEPTTADPAGTADPANPANQTTGQPAEPITAEPTTAESIKQNPNTKTQEQAGSLGVLQASITELEADTRYFVTIASYNSLMPERETLSDEVIEVVTKDDSTAPGMVTDLATDNTSIGGTSFLLQWTAPTETGTKPDGTALTPEEIGYHIYYLADPAGTTDPAGTAAPADPADPTTTESIRQNFDTQTQEVVGALQARLTGLLPNTDYLVTVVSYNSFRPQLETALDKAVTASTGDDSTAPGTTTGLNIDTADIESASFLVRWNVPEDRGTKADGTPLNPEEIGYRIYYLAVVAGLSVSRAALVRQDRGVRTREFTGTLQARLTGLSSETRYFVTIVSYNSFAEQLETASEEVVEGNTSANTTNFIRSLAYFKNSYEVVTGIDRRISPSTTPTIPGAATGVSISYDLEKIDGTEFFPEPSIAEDSGTITINSIANAGTARYLIRASATGYTTQNVIITLTITRADFEGSIRYAETEYRHRAESEGIITPYSIPTIPDTDSNGTLIRYELLKRSGTEFVPEPSINDSGIITISPNTNTGIAHYFIQASADGYNMQKVTLTITIIDRSNAGLPEVGTYYSSEATHVIPVELGQAIEDDGTLSFALTNNDAVLTVFNLANGEHSIHFGSEADNYSSTYQKTVTNNTITISKADLADNSFSFADGAAIGISGPDIIDTLNIATYLPSNIYNYRDLQAMRKDLGRDYMLKNNIEVPPAGAGTAASNYEAVGDESNPFTGSLDGANKSDGGNSGGSGGSGNGGSSNTSNTNYTITGIQIEGSDNYQGLFGVVEASAVDTIAAQNLVLNDFKITGNTHVGSLVGWIKRGTVNNVRVEGSSPADTGKVTIGDNTSGISYGGGLLGRAGIDATDIQVRIQNTSSAIAVAGTGTASNGIGGLVGYMNSDVMLTESYATEIVMGTNRVGGLVGGSSGTVTESYATGSVTGNTRVGGLVGDNTSGTVFGYATGDVTGSGDYVGGLVGQNAGTGIVAGYATGSVTGADRVGGLAGQNTGTVSGYAGGYAGGSVTGADKVGGLAGDNTGTVFGYARNVVRRSSGTSTDFGETVGASTETLSTYSSISESRIYDEATGRTELTDATGTNGDAVNIYDTSTYTAFPSLVFGTALGSWTWVANGKWPAINIGAVKAMNEQPVDSCVFAESVEQCRIAPTLQIQSYHNTRVGISPVELGAAIEDSSAAALASDTIIVTAGGLVDEEYTIHFGSVGNDGGGNDGGENDYGEGSYQKTASNGIIQVLKSDLAIKPGDASSFSFADGAVIGISRSGSTEIQHIATYRPSNIYVYQDLQAMKLDLDRHYILKRNIEFPPAGTGANTSTNNYEAVGDDITPFTGSLDGMGYSITGIEIESTGNYQGLFGVIKTGSVDIMAAQNLVLRDFKITGNAFVGSLAGWVKQGTVDNVRVEVSSADAGKVELSGSINIDSTNHGNGGGLVGSAGTGLTNVEVRIQNASSVVVVSGTGANSDNIGGLIGDLGSDVVLTRTFATGVVSGSSNNVGGLVGDNDGVVHGYATGSVSGSSNNVGGLVGENVGVVYGYATGSVIGGRGERVGGLIGNNYGTVRGYANGSVSGNKEVGGLVGWNNSGIVTGYARGVVRRSEGTMLSFGKTIGLDIGGTVRTFNSMSESKLYNGATGTTVLGGVTGIDGTAVSGTGATQARFTGFVFGTELGGWTWVANGKWPAINIGEVSPAADQPTNP